MELLSDNIILHHILPYIDAIVLPEIIDLRFVNKRFNRLVVLYYRMLLSQDSILTSEKAFKESMHATVGEFFSKATEVNEAFQEVMREAYEKINKVSVEIMNDHIFQQNQNRVDPDLLKVLDILAFWFDIKLIERNAGAKKSITQKQKDNISKYSALISEYWFFKNNFRKMKCLRLPESKIKMIKKKAKKIKPSLIESYEAVDGIAQYFKGVINYYPPETRLPLIFFKRFKDFEELSIEDISNWGQFLLSHMKVIF
ncbi:unnamed protein product [Blepharisma stoltei]|uniref:F-box domain-containing protein n=1 Tax=Blepharisma stoltei TaxID=1481888 RepID=A0AAU9ID03_9CILI|nr:unnamed protein product [Blepharisma stoltei]